MTRRPGAPWSGPVASAPAPATKVAPRQSTHFRDAALAAAAGLAGFGAAPLLGHPGFELPALAAGLGCGAVVAVTGERTKRRRDLEDRVLEAAAPLLCVRHLDRRIVKMTRWTSGWPGLPRRVRMHYAPGAPDNDPAWTSELLGVLASRLLAGYEIARHDQRRCTLWLSLITKQSPRRPPRIHRSAPNGLSPN